MNSNVPMGGSIPNLTGDRPKASETEKAPAPARQVGRPLKRDAPMSSSERNMRRVARMAATEIAAGDTVEQLWELHRELMSAGQSEWAQRIASVLRTNALRVAAENTRRNSAYFVRSGPSMLSPKETADVQRAISLLADEIDKLVNLRANTSAIYQRFEEILHDLRACGFWIEGGLVSAVARAFALG